MPKSGAKRPPSPAPTPRKAKKQKRKPSRATKVKRAKAAVSTNIITDQFDKRVDYVHVKKRVNKKGIAFKKKVLSVLQTQLPVVTRLFTTATAGTQTTAVTEQCWQIFHLKPWDGQAAAPGAGSLYNEVAQNDLKTLSGNLDGTAIGSPSGDTLSPNFWIKQAYMDIICENSGANDAILEVYELDYVPRAGNPINQYASFNAALTAAITSTVTYGTTYSLNTKGVSPFDISELLRTYGIRVVKKMTNEFQANGKFVYTLKDYRKHYVSADAISRDLGSKYCIQNMTKSVLVVAKTTQNDGAVTMRATAEKHYRIQPIADIQDTTAGGSG